MAIDDRLAAERTNRGLRIGEMFALACWFGLLAGLLEVCTKLICACVGWHGRLYLMSRHFFWLIPVTNLLIFVAVGFVFSICSCLFPRGRRWLGVRLFGALALLPALIVAVPSVYTAAWFLVAFGVAIQFTPVFERRASAFRRLVVISFPILLGVVVLLAGWVFGQEWLKRRREAARPLPSASSMNVLLVVLDTVRADRLSVYGYARETTPTLDRLAARGVRFNEAQATSSWTLPSHGSMFTGRLPQELKADWVSPIDKRFPTLAEYLGSRGYSTAGFVGNTLYCSYDTGLSKGFTHYEDYNLQQLDAFLMARLTERALTGFFQVSAWVRGRWHSEALAPVEMFIQKHVYASNRKNAAAVNRDFFEWLSTRDEPTRPFFAFLNYIDAHDSYFPPRGAGFPFGLSPVTANDFTVLQNWESLDKRNLHPHFRQLVSDCYDDCVRYMDDQVFMLLSKLSSMGLLGNTLIVITADHGESFGEHGLYRHGNSLYRTEIHVPLLVVMPGLRPARWIVDDVVSLRDLPATIIDLAGLADWSPIPGRSLARFWNRATTDPLAGEPAVAQLGSPNPVDLGHQAPSPAENGSITAVMLPEYKYIEERARQRLFLRADTDENADKAEEPAMQSAMERARTEVRRVSRP